MKFFDRLILKLFSLIIIALSVLTILVMASIVDLDIIISAVEDYLNEDVGLAVVIGVLAVLMLLAIKGLLFTSKNRDNNKDGIVLENNSGKLVISKESLDNLISSSVKDIPGTEGISSKTTLDKNKNLIIYVTVAVSKDVMIKDVSTLLQERIKESMKKSADLEVKEVNIKIKNITSKKVKNVTNNTNTEENVKETQEENNIESDSEKSESEENKGE